MRVLVGPRSDLERDQVIAAAARALAGPAGSVVSLADAGVGNLSRRLSPAEVALLREALRGGRPGGRASADDMFKDESEQTAEGPIVGYVCRGNRLDTGDVSGAARVEDRLVVVTDHANLTWRSPLTGPNDDALGPRFPSMAGVYSSETAVNRLVTAGIIVGEGVVAGVLDDTRPTPHEAEVARAQGHSAVSSELVPVVIVAAHLGMRVAAVVLTAGS
jgi:hypothetical protein